MRSNDKTPKKEEKMACHLNACKLAILQFGPKGFMILYIYIYTVLSSYEASNIHLKFFWFNDANIKEEVFS